MGFVRCFFFFFKGLYPLNPIFLLRYAIHIKLIFIKVIIYSCFVNEVQLFQGDYVFKCGGSEVLPLLELPGGPPKRIALFATFSF